ncbi:MAG: DapH/DapD/GlmU-related protein [Planctomycetota bacterium]|nr:DapH/DapD/GlmU-related protein [Planctomycetota bacterium]
MDAADHATDSSRGTSPYTTKEKMGRLLWGIVQATLFRCTFHNWYGVRRGLLGIFGARLDRTARVRASVRIECPWNLTIGADSAIGDRATIYCLGPVTIGARVTISQHAHVCAGSHDYRSRLMPLLRPPITIGDDVWIAADAFVGPNVTIGDGAILGARAVALKSVPPWSIALGNPAQVVKSRPRPV